MGMAWAGRYVETILSVGRGNSTEAKNMCMAWGRLAIFAACASVTSVCTAHGAADMCQARSSPL
ncbi:hypothetical protein KY290_012891 [Solanum tuberosum]|uniref:Uncharacterized protein n=1 Tax=Solanum tuberosum TaxID=4113 RepID=A0ABQ7VK57_SOLTU|nr:hypothetical protein KY285_012643 [Solanum tuberosum]KAH0768910.1 hypothetical protein KY290_012891 [Solanum tuberosum]